MENMLEKQELDSDFINKLNEIVSKIEYGASFPPLMDKKTAANYLQISIPTLKRMEKVGFDLSESITGGKPMYFKEKLSNIHIHYKKWKQSNPEQYAELQR